MQQFTFRGLLFALSFMIPAIHSAIVDAAPGENFHPGWAGHEPRPAPASRFPDHIQEKLSWLRVRPPVAIKPRKDDRTRAVNLGRQLKPGFDLDDARQCERELRALGVEFTVVKPLGRGKACGWPRPVSVTAVQPGVKVVGDLKLRCEAALALAQWTRHVVQPQARDHLGTSVTALETGSSYACRRRNNARRTKLSEHAFANAIDLMAIHLDDKPVMRIRRQKDPSRKTFQKNIRKKSCEYFTTVLGPGANRQHADHLHFDLALHKGGYEHCE